MLELVKFGKTNLYVSRLCLGTMYFGNQIEKSLSFHLLDGYFNYGGNFIDTANIYSFWIAGFKGGESEKLIGNWIKKRKNRSKLIISSKVGFAYNKIEKGLKAKQIIQECEKSLKRLNTDVIDIYFAHGDDFSTPIEESLGAFNKLIKDGKVRYIGASNFFSWRLAQARMMSEISKIEQYCCIQQRYTYFQPVHKATFEHYQIHASDEILTYCQFYNIPLLAYSILLNGAYSNQQKILPEQYVSVQNAEKNNNLKWVADEIGATINQTIILWLINQATQIIPIIGASSMGQLEELIDSFDFSLNKNHLKLLDTYPYTIPSET